jgi:selT/selW/selH-like putative selenoprotein
VFEVVADGKLVFSKKASGRFPSDSEVLESLQGPGL